jgi:poly(3-hydroxybutyrate) depolymerase
MIRKFCLTLAVAVTASFTIVSAQQTAKVTASGIGYLEYVPQGYNSNSNKYPIVISLHGIREKGTTSKDRSRIIADLQKVDNVGLPKYVKYGQKYPFILISPQLKNGMGSWPPNYIIEVLKHVKKYLRIDDRRVYLTGLSLGGLGVWRTVAEYPEVFAAIGPICPGGNSLSNANKIAAANVAAWGFHGSSDKIVSYKVTTNMISAMNTAPKKPNPLAKATIFNGMGHVIWDKAYNQTNLLDWMLSHKKGSSGGSSNHDDDDDDGHGDDDNDRGDDGDDNDDKSSDHKNNKAPVVKAGSDRTITLPTNTISLHGSAKDSDGRILSWQWTKVSGGSATLSRSRSSRLEASKLTQGTYVFRLTARDNDGAITSDDVTVHVRTSGQNNHDAPDNKGDGDGDKTSNKPNQRPNASAGPDRILTLPQNAISIQGNASDPDGKIVSWQWVQTYGRRVNLSGENTPTVRVSDLKKGAHIFKLVVKDDGGAIREDYFKITVNNGKSGSEKSGKDDSQAKDNSENSNSGNKNSGNNNSGNNNSKTNAKPVANAGPDLRAKESQSSITLNGSGRDSDGQIVSYQWKQLAGPSINLRNRNGAQAQISDLKKGRYYFSLTVRDNNNATHVDKMAIRVSGK